MYFYCYNMVLGLLYTSLITVCDVECRIHCLPLQASNGHGTAYITPTPFQLTMYRGCVIPHHKTYPTVGHMKFAALAIPSSIVCNSVSACGKSSSPNDPLGSHCLSRY